MADVEEVDIEGFTHGGEGVGRRDGGKVVFVPETIPGERVRVRVTQEHKRWSRGELVEVIDPSPDRVLQPCPYVQPDRERRCGGCDLQHIVPARQRSLKSRVVREQLQRLGGIADPPVAATLAAGDAVRYRNRARFHAAEDGRLGFHAAGTHDVVPIAECLVLGETAQTVRDTVGDGSGATEVEVRGHAGGAAATIRPGGGALELPDGEFDLLLVQPDGSTVTMRGDGVLSEEVRGLVYRFPADAFFQVNTRGTAVLVEEVLRAVGDVRGNLVWDLYAGVGLFAVPLALRGAEVVAVEGGADADRWIEINAGEAGVVVTGVAAEVGSFVTGSDARRDPPDVVVLDPPRIGAGTDVCGALADLGPGVIVYVACDVAALARDARALTSAGYRLDHAQPVDLFPHTHHIEVVARFVRGAIHADRA